MTSIAARLHNAWFRLRDHEGQTLVEYSLIVALIALVCIGALTVLGGKISDLLQRAGSSIANVPTTTTTTTP